MSTKAGIPIALILTLVGACCGWAADPPSPFGMPASSAPTTLAGQAASTAPGSNPLALPITSSVAQDMGGSSMSVPGANATDQATTSSGGYSGPGSPGQPQPTSSGPMPACLSSWITYTRPDCCGPVGGNGPINTELYVRTGPNFTFGDSRLAELLNDKVGWDFTGGGRSLFFNPDQSAAWAIDLGITYIYNQSNENLKVNELVTIPPAFTGAPSTSMVEPVTLKRLHRTFVNASLGREWYLNAPADACGWHWRAGADVGGQLGTARADFVEIRHLTDTIYGSFVALHTDVEKQCGCCTYMAGFRAEYGFTWSDVLKTVNSNTQDVNLLVTFGVRF